MPQAHVTETQPAKGGQRSALLCACVVGFAYSANYTNHAPLVPALTREFGFSLALAGLLTTAIFLTHAAMQIPGGLLADRLGASRLVTVSLAQVCIGNFAIALASSYSQLLFWKLFVGLGTGTCFVAGARYVSTAFPGTRAHLAQGYFGGSVMLGSGFVIFAVPRFAAVSGWRGGFILTAAIAAIAWIIWASSAPLLKGQHHPPGSFRGMVANPQLWLLGLIQMASFGLVIVVSSWITTFLRRGPIPDPGRAGMLGSLALILGIVVRPLGGACVRSIGIHPLIRLSLVLTTAGCFGLALAGSSVVWIAVAVILLGAGCGLPYAALFTRAAELYPGRAGAAMGLVNMLGIVMILAAPPLIGRLVDWSGSFRSSFLALGVFSILALTSTLGIRQS